MDIQPTTTLWGRRLRWVLLVLLADGHCPLTVAELIRGLERAGWSIHGRPSKAVSDALRWEVRRGRVVRVARSTYAVGHLPRSTAWWVRQQVRALVPIVQPPSDNPRPAPDWLAVVATRLDNTQAMRPPA